MTPEQLADRLRETYFTAMSSNAGVTVAICLFGARHANEILASGVAIHRLFRIAGIPNLAPTVNLGMNLSEYISIEKMPLPNLNDKIPPVRTETTGTPPVR